MRASQLTQPVCRLTRVTLALAITVGGLALAHLRPVSASTGTLAITRFLVPGGCTCQGIAAGSDGNLWFTELLTIKVGRSTIGGAMTQFQLPGQPALNRTSYIAAGPDGALWVTVTGLGVGAGKIARITTGGSVTLVAVPGSSFVNGIAVGPDGNLWVTDSLGKIDRVTTMGHVREFGVGPRSNPYMITGGPDGNLWFTDFRNKRIGKITPGGALTYFAVPGGSLFPHAIVAGPDGNLWFTTDSIRDAKVGRITTAGAITLFPLPHPKDGVAMNGITVGPDGALWFTISDFTTHKGGLGRITTSGQAAAFSVPEDSAPMGITIGPDQALWFADGDGALGRVAIG